MSEHHHDHGNRHQRTHTPPPGIERTHPEPPLTLVEITTPERTGSREHRLVVLRRCSLGRTAPAVS